MERPPLKTPIYPPLKMFSAVVCVNRGVDGFGSWIWQFKVTEWKSSGNKVGISIFPKQ